MTRKAIFTIKFFGFLGHPIFFIIEIQMIQGEEKIIFVA